MEWTPLIKTPATLNYKLPTIFLFPLLFFRRPISTINFQFGSISLFPHSTFSCERHTFSLGIGFRHPSLSCYQLRRRHVTILFRTEDPTTSERGAYPPNWKSSLAFTFRRSCYRPTTPKMCSPWVLRIGWTGWIACASFSPHVFLTWAEFYCVASIRIVSSTKPRLLLGTSNQK